MSFSAPTPWAASWEDSLDEVADAAVFLLERVAEDERAARAEGGWACERVLGDATVKRDVVRRFRLMLDAEPGETRTAESVRVEQLVLGEMICRFAAVYAGHPGYREAWRRP